jgi:hypothetical protein
MGYLSEAMAMMNRYRRCRNAWLPHLEKTKEAVADAAASCRNRGKVIVLGSGLLLDLPLEMLAACFEEVVLVDIVHLPHVFGRTRHHPNVNVVQSDITGVAEQLFRGVRSGRMDLPKGSPLVPGVDDRAGLVVSLNILSQLSVVPCRFAHLHMSRPEDTRLSSWSDAVLHAHYAALQALTCDVSVIADYRYVLKDETGNIVSEGSTISSLPLPEPASSWTWQLAPRGEISAQHTKELLVGAWRRLSE